MTAEFFKALAMIFMAEMGDKTQIIAMGLAIKYPIRKILVGIALGVVVNHGLAILLGSMLSRVIPISWLQVAAGALFLFFAFGSLSVEEEEVEEEKGRYGVVLAVALSFFLGEMGDKTQLTALGLGSTSSHPILVLMGTTSGMVLTSLIGILIGIKLGKSIDPGKLKLGAFAVFSLFGMEKLYTHLFVKYGIVSFFYGLVVVFATVSFILIRRFLRQVKAMEETQFQRQAQALYDLKHKIQSGVENMCQDCAVCDGKKCLVGFLKAILAMDTPLTEGDLKVLDPLLNKSFNRDEALDLLDTILDYYRRFEKEYEENAWLMEARRILELIAFGAQAPEMKLEEYLQYVEEKRGEIDG